MEAAFFAAGFFELVVEARLRLDTCLAVVAPASIRGTSCASVSSRIVSGRFPQSISLLWQYCVHVLPFLTYI